MTHLTDTISLFENFEQSCLNKEIDDSIIRKMDATDDLMGPATRLAYIQTRMMQSIATSLCVIADKPPHPN